MGATFAEAPLAAPDETITSENCNENDFDLERAEREIIAHLKHEKERRAGNCPADCWQCGKNKRDNEKAKAHYSNAEQHHFEQGASERSRQARLLQVEKERGKKIEEPWLYETGRMMNEPPDIDLRKHIVADKKVIDELFEDGNLHFTDRCLRYQRQDVYLQGHISNEYCTWAWYMEEDADRTGDQTRKKFFRELWESTMEDFNELVDEWTELGVAERGREHQRVARLFGVSPNQDDWSSEHWLRWQKMKRSWMPSTVPGWIRPQQELLARQVSLQLGIVKDRSLWTSEEAQRYVYYNLEVPLWGQPGAVAYRRQRARELSIPENIRDWSPDDRQRYIDSGEKGATWGWPMVGRQDAWPGWTDVGANLTVEGRAAEKRLRERSFPLWAISDDEEGGDAAKVGTKGMKNAILAPENSPSENAKNELRRRPTKLDERTTPKSLRLRTANQQGWICSGANHTSAYLLSASSFYSATS